MERFGSNGAWLRYKWHLLTQYLYHNGPKRDYFRLVHVILTIGGTYFESTKKWPCLFWRCYMYLTFGHFVIIALNLTESVLKKDDSIATFGFIRVLFIFSTGLTRDSIVRLHIDSIKHAERFINDSNITSNDNCHDRKVREALNRKIQLTCLGMLAIVSICLLFVPLLMSQQDKSYQLPQILVSFGPVVANVIQVTYVMTIFPLWVNKALGPTTLMTALLSGFETEFKIVCHGFGCFVENVIFGQHDATFWELLKQRIRFHIQQHIQCSENLMQLQHLIKHLYFVIHYHSMIMIASSIFMLMLEGTWAGRLIIVIGIGTFFVECYWWCSLAESFQNMNQIMDEYVFDLMTAIPYQANHHSDYVQLQKMLHIFKTNIRNGAQFSCGGMFKLSMEAFRHIGNRSYVLLTFLLNVGPQSSGSALNQNGFSNKMP